MNDDLQFKLMIVGGGRLGSALVSGLIESEWAKPKEVAIVEKDALRQVFLKDNFKGLFVSESYVEASGAVIVVKPKDAKETLEAFVSQKTLPKRILSVMAGIRTEKLIQYSHGRVPILRAMPNTPALVLSAASALAKGENATDEDLEWGRQILLALGAVEIVDEEKLDAVTGLSGSGPAYIFYLAQAMIEAGIELGLDPQISKNLVTQTFLGSATLMAQSKESARELREMVTSPNGTTAKGIETLDQEGFYDAVKNAIKQATSRSIEMSQE